MEPYIDVKILKKNTTLLIETSQTIYEIKVINPKDGSMLIHGGLRFIRLTNVKFLGCIDTNKSQSQETNLTDLCICRNKPMMFMYTHEGNEHNMSTAPVLTARVSGPKGGWYYDVIEKAEGTVSSK